MTFSLTYHDLAPAGELDRYGFPGPAAGRYKLDPRTFETHLDAIAQTGVRIGLLGDDPECALTFDDGGASALAIADALECRGWRGNFFITTGRIGTTGFLDAGGVAELARRGHEVGSHSQSHPTYMATLTPAQLLHEWRASRDNLGAILGEAPRTAAVPGGFLSPRVVAEAARAGYRLLMTSQPSGRTHWHDGMEIQGRCTIWRGTTPERAAAYARGDRLARASLWLAWHGKTAPKRLSPRTYEAARQLWARRRRR